MELRALDDMDNPIADGVMDLLFEEQRREIAREARRGKLARARTGRVVASVAPYDFRFNRDNTNFLVEETGAPVVRRIFRMLAAGHSVNGVKSALQEDGVPRPRGGTHWSQATLRQMVNVHVYKPHTREELEGLVEEVLISMAELRDKLDALNAEHERVERELRGLEDRDTRLRELEELPDLVEEYLRDLPHLLCHAPSVREHETAPKERTEDNPLGTYVLAPENIRHLTDEELAEKRRAAEDARGERFRAIYEDLGFRVTAHPDGTLEVEWKFGGNAKLLRLGNDVSPNRHATKHFRSTEHPLVQSFEPGEDWIFCYVDKVVMEPR